MNNITAAIFFSFVSLATTQAQAQYSNDPNSSSCTSSSSGRCETGYVNPLEAGKFLHVAAKTTGVLGRSLGTKVEIINCSGIVINTKTADGSQEYFIRPNGNPGVRARVNASGFGSLAATSASLKITKFF